MSTINEDGSSQLVGDSEMARWYVADAPADQGSTSGDEGQSRDASGGGDSRIDGSSSGGMSSVVAELMWDSASEVFAANPGILKLGHDRRRLVKIAHALLAQRKIGAPSQIEVAQGSQMLAFEPRSGFRQIATLPALENDLSAPSCSWTVWFAPGDVVEGMYGPIDEPFRDGVVETRRIGGRRNLTACVDRTGVPGRAVVTLTSDLPDEERTVHVVSVPQLRQFLRQEMHFEALSAAERAVLAHAPERHIAAAKCDTRSSLRVIRQLVISDSDGADVVSLLTVWTAGANRLGYYDGYTTPAQVDARDWEAPIFINLESVYAREIHEDRRNGLGERIADADLCDERGPAPLINVTLLQYLTLLASTEVMEGSSCEAAVLERETVGSAATGSQAALRVPQTVLEVGGARELLTIHPSFQVARYFSWCARRHIAKLRGHLRPLHESVLRSLRPEFNDTVPPVDEYGVSWPQACIRAMHEIRNPYPRSDGRLDGPQNGRLIVVVTDNPAGAEFVDVHLCAFNRHTSLVSAVLRRVVVRGVSPTTLVGLFAGAAVTSVSDFGHAIAAEFSQDLSAYSHHSDASFAGRPDLVEPATISKTFVDSCDDFFAHLMEVDRAAAIVARLYGRKTDRAAVGIAAAQDVFENWLMSAFDDQANS